MTDADLLAYLQSRARHSEPVWDTAKRLAIAEAARQTSGITLGRFVEMARLLRCTARAVHHYARGSVCQGCSEGEPLTHRHAPLIEMDIEHNSHWRDVPVL